MICQGIAGHLIDDIAFVWTDPAQVGLERDHAPISVEQRLLIISSTTASFVSGSKNGLSYKQKRVAAPLLRRHSAGQLHWFLWWRIIQRATPGVQSQS